jgi:hypothetical protein
MCGKQFRPSYWRKIIIVGSAILLPVVIGVIVLNNLDKHVLSDDCDSYKSIPKISGETKKMGIAVLETNEHGGIYTGVIHYDTNKNWKLHINGNNYRSYKSMDNVTPPQTFINETMLNYNPDKVLYVYKNDNKGFIRDKLSISQFESALGWRSETENYYLTFATVPATLRDSSCMVVIYKNQIVFSYIKDGIEKKQSILNAGYQTNVELKNKMFEDALHSIPSENQFYFFTSGYTLTGIKMDKYADDDFTPVNHFIQKQISNGDKEIDRILDIYQFVQSVSGKCLIYRKHACPEIGYLLYKVYY